MNCHQCHTELPPGAKFCFNCGAPQLQQEARSEFPRIDFNGDVARQLERLFFDLFATRIREEHEADKLSTYSERLYETGFRDIVNRRVAQLAEQLLEQRGLERDTHPLQEEVLYIFEELIDFFLIRYCADLNMVQLPEAILKYQDLRLENIDLSEMIPDYLALDQESETVYTDFIIMPVEKLKNASRAFLFPQKEEHIFFICDQSLLGSCKEGFSLTDKAIYWKAHLEKARAVYYTQIHSVERKKDWLIINGHFFNAGPSLNLKLMKLLKRLRFGRS